MSKSTVIVFNATMENCEKNPVAYEGIVQNIKNRPAGTGVILVGKNILNSAFKADDINNCFEVESSKFNSSEEINTIITENDLGKSLVILGFDSVGNLFVSALSLSDYGYDVTIAKSGLASPNGYEMTGSLIKILQKNLGKRAVK